MLVPHAVNIAVTISSLIASICFTFADDIFLFVNSSYTLVSGNIQTKVYDPRKDRPTDRSIDQASGFALTKLLFRIQQNSR